MTKIVTVEPLDVRLPSSRTLDGSDAMNTGDYSATYVTVRADEPGLEGHGLTFTNGRGNELCVAVPVPDRGGVGGRRASPAPGGSGDVHG